MQTTVTIFTLMYPGVYVLYMETGVLIPLTGRLKMV